MIELPVIDAADQEFSAILGGQRTTIRLRYAPLADRWTLDLSLDDDPVITGRAIVPGVDLIPASFGIGHIVAASAQDGAVLPVGRTELVSGAVRLYHFTDAELAAVA